MKWVTAILIGLWFTAQPAAAWTEKGHIAVATIAEANLTPAARAQIKALLEGDLDSRGNPSGKTRLTEIAIWADEIRELAPENMYIGWHTRSNPVCSQKLGLSWFGVSVDKKLTRYAYVLFNPKASHHERNEALKWVVHLVGDLHQPLHSGSNSDGAGNIPAKLEGQKGPYSTLHWLWDRDLANAALNGYPLTAKLPHSDKLSPDAVMQWMLETRDVSRKHVYDPLPGFACGVAYNGPVVLDRAYQEQALPVIRQQIERAGLRLAQLLNELLK